MPYEIETKDGIVIRGIPDDVKPDDPKIRAKVTNARQAAGRGDTGATSADRAMADPTNGFWQNAWEGYGKAGADLWRGVKQVAGANNQAEIDESRQLDKPLMATGGGVTGNIAGNVAATLPAMAIPGVNGIVGGAALGAGLGAAQPVATGESRGENMAIGAAGGAAVPALGAAWRTGKSILEPLYGGGRDTVVGRTLNRVAGENAPAVQQRLALARELVPGSAPTAAEVAESGGVAALQRAASAADPEAYATRGMQQASARADALRNIAGTDKDLANAKAVRGLMSDSLYADAMKAKVPLDVGDKKISEIMSRPSLESAWQEAEKMAREAGITSVTSKGEMTGEALHYVKMALDQKIADAKPGSPAQRLLMGTRNDLRDWMEKAIPEYGKAREAFASWSPAVDQHRVGTYLAEKLQPALADHGALGSETGAQYAAALRNAPSTLQKSTGFGGASRELSDIMSPSQMNTLENVGADLGRKANAQNLGRGAGSDTMQKLSMSNIGEQSGMPKLVDLVSSLPGISRATNWVYRDTDNQIRSRLAQALLNPQESAQLMRAAQGNPQLARALREAQRVMIPAGAGAALEAR